MLWTFEGGLNVGVASHTSGLMEFEPVVEDEEDDEGVADSDGGGTAGGNFQIGTGTLKGTMLMSILIHRNRKWQKRLKSPGQPFP